jgi:hypothetical protein
MLAFMPHALDARLTPSMAASFGNRFGARGEILDMIYSIQNLYPGKNYK